VEPSEKFDAYVKIRYASKPVLASIEKYVPDSDDLNQYEGQAWKISFYEAQRAIAPGQSAVLYLDNLMIGGGFIHHSL
jgi:tRNA-specific 2-thiouridylase